MKKHLNLIHPTFKTLVFVCFIYGVLISILLAISIFNKIQALGITSIIVGGALIVYLIYSSVTMILDFLDSRKERGIIKTIKRGGKMMTFVGTIFSSFLNFIFSYVYLIVAFSKMHFFYLFISLFYLIALILKYFILSSVYEDSKKVIIRNYIITSIGIIILGIFMAIIVIYVVRSEGNFTKSIALLVFNIIFAIFKALSALHAFRKHKRKKSYLKLSLSLIAMSFCVFTIFTIHVALLNIYSASLFSLNFTGYPFATVILAIGIFSLIFGIREYKLVNKEEENDDSL